MNSWKNRLVALTAFLLGLALLVFLVTGGAALYWAWLRANLQAALPYLPWARNSGMLAVACAAGALGILFASETFPIPPRTRLLLSALATVTIAFFAEFRNDGKFHFKKLLHFFGPGTWIHHALNQCVSSLGDALYRIEYSHWNDFLMGPAIVSVLYSVAFVKIYEAVRNQVPATLSASPHDAPGDLDHALRFARILMNVGLFWFFIDAWAEKAGYLSSPHSRDEIDLPFEFAGTVLGFWMVRALTKPFGRPAERYRSTLLIDFLSSGVIGLLYTLIVGWLTEGVAGSVAHALYPAVPGSLDMHEYTPFQQHMRPFELLLLAAVMCWGLNRSFKREEIARISSTDEQPEATPRWDVLVTIGLALGAVTGYLLIVATMLSLLEPQGLGWTLATAGAGMGAGTVAFLLARRAWPQRVTTLLVRSHESSGSSRRASESEEESID